MTTELMVLTLTAILAASLWMPYIILSGRPDSSEHQSFDRMARVWEMSDAAQRAYRAHQNLLEQFLPFAVVLVVAHLAQVSTAVTVWASVVFLVLRVLHAVGYFAGWARMPLPPLLFTGGWLCILAIAASVLLA
jgi:uncharacterized MAPEG superfamily protein